jgi:hypothetical protein
MVMLQQYAVTRNGTVNINNFPRYTITAQVIGDDGTTVLADFTGANALSFPAVLSTLTAQQRDDFIAMIAIWIVRVRAGLDP